MALRTYTPYLSSSPRKGEALAKVTCRAATAPFLSWEILHSFSVGDGVFVTRRPKPSGAKPRLGALTVCPRLSPAGKEPVNRQKRS